MVVARTAAVRSARTLRSVARPWVIGHRGNSSVAPENTLAAFESALRAGADWLELDVHLSRDGLAVVLHDQTIDATTNGSGRLHELDAKRLTGLDAGRWFADAYEGQRVPLLSDVLDLLERFPRSGVLVEFKGVWSRARLRPVVAALRRSPVVDRVVVQSFSITTVEGLQALGPELRRGLLSLLPGPEPGRMCERLGLSAYNPSVAGLLRRPEVVAEVHEAGTAVWSWTADEPELWSWLLGAGVDAVITNRPDRLIGWLDATLAPRAPGPVDLHRLALGQGSRAAPAAATATMAPQLRRTGSEPPDLLEWERLTGELAR